MEEKYPAGKMNIYFGSQTGTAKEFAGLLSTSCRKIGFEAKVIDLADFQPEQLATSRLAIFLVATYGEGDPTDNALRFYDWLCNKEGSIPETYLSSVSFAVFGLGNSTYPNYNQMGKKCNEKLELLGGQRVFPLACGDDSCSLEVDYEAWKKGILEFLTQKYVPQVEELIEIQELHPRAHLTFTTQVVPPSEAITPPPTEINTTTKYFFTSSVVSLTSVRDLRSSADPGRTLHLEFDISKSEIKYNPADNLAVVPENDQTMVESFASCCGGYNLSQCVTLVPTEPDDDVEEFCMTTFKHPFPNPCTVQTIFQKYLDISGIPRRSTLERFGSYIKDKKQLKWLDDLISKESRDRYSQDIESEGRTYASLLANELSSCVIPLDDLLHLIPFIQPRYYTISSSDSVHPGSLHLTGTSPFAPSPSFLITPFPLVSLLQRTSPSGSKICGLCTKFLSSLSPGDSCRVFPRESLFKLPASLSTPVIMIGPGSGIAPMRALIQEREYRARSENIPLSDMTNILYFGCKSRRLDFLYEEELTAALDRQALTALRLAFSRETDDKVYVQHLMRLADNEKEIARLLDSGAHIFVCGGTEMGAAVAESFAAILSNQRSKSHPSLLFSHSSRHLS